MFNTFSQVVPWYNIPRQVITPGEKVCISKGYALYTIMHQDLQVKTTPM